MKDIHHIETAGETASKNPIRLTPAAVAEVKRLLAEQPKDTGTMLRVGVTGGGCGGLTYKMKFDTAAGENDRVIEYDGLKVVVDHKSLAYMDGTVIDYSAEMLTGGFKFENPQSTRNCGCGTSFTV